VRCDSFRSPERPGSTTGWQPTARHGANAGIDEESHVSEQFGARWPDGRAKSVHHIQAKNAFGLRSDAYPGRLIWALNDEALVDRLSDHSTVALVVARPERLAAVLRRTDICLIEAAPLVLLSEARGVLGIATGPAEPPPELRVLSNISRLEDGESVEIPAVDDDQPSLQLLAARPMARGEL
jgi:hypothetical protein